MRLRSLSYFPYCAVSGARFPAGLKPVFSRCLSYVGALSTFSLRISKRTVSSLEGRETGKESIPRGQPWRNPEEASDRPLPRCPSAASSTSPGGSSGTAQSSAGSSEVKLGVVPVTSFNINTEMDTRVPLLLYFTLHNHPDLRAYTQRITHQVDQVNRRSQSENYAEVYGEFGKDAGLAIKIGVIDCLAEEALKKKFNISPHSFPIVYFIYRKCFCDMLTGVVEESHAKEAIEAFIEYGKEEAKNEKEGKSVFGKLKVHDNDDENAFTLLSKGHKHLQSNEISKARDLFSKSLRYAKEELEEVQTRYGIRGKKLTLALWEKLKREPSYNSTPQALCGLAMCAMAVEDRPEAQRLITEIRTDFPFSTKDMLDLAEAVVRMELMILTDFNVQRDTYISLMKYDNLVDDPVAFYRQHVKLAVAHFMEGAHQRCIEECLRIIRAERKLLPALKEGKVVPHDLELNRTAETPARKVILSVMEALGPMNEHVITGRKMLQLYI